MDPGSWWRVTDAIWYTVAQKQQFRDNELEHWNFNFLSFEMILTC